ncbi:MAG: hypothetical protein A2139_10975 [Desulfobacca sp. RBG_16_60_12]|nr:MAG: hypothetical protein A2139_10975 [Desulfobacca sp. RBG_16_60_12]
MELGIVSAFLMMFEFEEGLRFAHDLGLRHIEVGACGIAAKKYCDLDRLLAEKDVLHRWVDTYSRHDLEICALAGHGAPLSPDKKIADEYRRQFRQACELSERIGVKRMTLVAGLPEGADGDKCPVWITQQTDVPFYRDTLDWQWEKRLIPYWKEQGKIAEDHGITLCFEMQVGDMIHNPVKLKRLREEVGAVIACNFDISHMWAQGMDPIAALRYLGNLVKHVHIKDTLIHEHNMKVHGFNDTTSPSSHPELRSWSFALPGWGHDERTWREVIATLRLIGYDGVLSVEMECEYISIKEGLEKSVAFLKPIVLREPTGARWWEVAEFRELWGQTKTDGKDSTTS